MAFFCLPKCRTQQDYSPQYGNRIRKKRIPFLCDDVKIDAGEVMLITSTTYRSFQLQHPYCPQTYALSIVAAQRCILSKCSINVSPINPVNIICILQCVPCLSPDYCVLRIWDLFLPSFLDAFPRMEPLQTLLCTNIFFQFPHSRKR